MRLQIDSVSEPKRNSCGEHDLGKAFPGTGRIDCDGLLLRDLTKQAPDRSPMRDSRMIFRRHKVPQPQQAYRD